MELHSLQAQGRQYAAARMMTGMDQGELARAAGVSPSTISNLESGETEPRRTTLKAVKRALRTQGVSFSHDILNGNLIINVHYDTLDD